jgi:dipeptidyl peptidase-like protein
VIASHYAEPVDCIVVGPVTLRQSPSDEGEPVRELAPGEPFAMLDESLGWAWGYAGKERRVGYVRSAAVRPN